MVARTRGSCPFRQAHGNGLLGPTNFQASNHNETRLPGWTYEMGYRGWSPRLAGR
jgi:hypothetical protein